MLPISDIKRWARKTDICPEKFRLLQTYLDYYRLNSPTPVSVCPKEISLATLQQPVAISEIQIPTSDGGCEVFKMKQEEKENTMSHLDHMESYELTPDERKASFLENELERFDSKKTIELRQKFGLEDDDRPRTPTELIDRIKAGLYVLNEDRKDYRTNWPLDYISWRDPSKQKDQKGYAAAYDKLQALLKDTQRAIVIQTPAEGLIALKAFETATIQ